MSKFSGLVRGKGGFGLLGVTIALVIIGMITAGIFQFMNAQMRQQQIRTTKTNLDIIKVAMDEYQQLNGH